MATIREESTEDPPAIRRVLEQAFGQPKEANLVDELRRRGAITLSLVATQDDQVVGHILFTPATINAENSILPALGLGPLAVLPVYQNQGIGSELVRTGLEKCRHVGHRIVVVLGHPNYYPRFGFTPARAKGVQCEFDVPDEVFMVAELREGALAGRGGVARYQPEFSSV